MKSFKCTIERTDEYIIEFDEDICNEEWMADFRDVFFNFHHLDEHAEHVAQMRMRFGRGFIEGYGIPLENGKVPYWAYSEEMKSQINHAINIKIISEDDDIYTNVGYID